MNDLSPQGRRSWSHRMLALAVSLPLVTSGLLIVGEVAASAHTTAIQGVASCNTTTGTYSVTWTGATDQVPAGDLASVVTTAHSPAGSTVPATVTTTLAPNAPYTFIQSDIPGTSTTGSVAVHVVWVPNPVNPNKLPTSNFAADASGRITGLTGCTTVVVTPTQSIAGHIYDCVGGATTTTEHAGGTLGATGPQAVPGQANPLAPVNVPAGSYSMTATAPTGFQLVNCGVAGSPSTKPVQVPVGGLGVGVFYVAPIPVVPPTVPAPKPVVGGATGGVQGPTTTPVVHPRPVVHNTPPLTGTTAQPGALPFTGPHTAAVLRLALLLLVSGVALLVIGGARGRKV